MASTYSAPGVYRKELDLSEILVPTGTTNGGIVVRAKKGPIKRPVLVTTDQEYIERFGKPIFTDGLKDSTGKYDAIGGELVPEYGYGAYGALQFLSEANTLFVVRAYGEDDKYAYTVIDNHGVGSSAAGYDGISADFSIPESYDTRERISTIDEFYRDNIRSDSSKSMLVSYLGPGDDGNDVSVVVETLNPYSDWVYKFDEYPTDTSGTLIPTNCDNITSASIWNETTGGGATAVKEMLPIASKVVKVSIYNKPDDKIWEDFYSSNDDRYNEQLCTSASAPKLRTEPIEVFYGSMGQDHDADGNDLFIERRINGHSKYIYVKSNSEFNLDTSWDFDSNNWCKRDTSCGVTGSLCTSADGPGCSIVTSNKLPYGIDANGSFTYNTSAFNNLNGGGSADMADFGEDGSSQDSLFWEYFKDSDNVPVNILINTYFDDVSKMTVGNIAAGTMNAIACNQVGDVTMVDFRDVLNAEKYGYVNPSFVALYSGYSRVYDKYNDKDVYLPNSIYGASLMARVDNIAQPWFAPSGITRGTMSVLDQNKSYSSDAIGFMYDRNINSVKYIPGNGVFAMWGQKTAQLKSSALDRINVRRLLIYVEYNIEQDLNQFIFENNNQLTRARVTSLIESFMDGVLAGGGVYDYTLVCDESNNTPDVIDKNQLNVDLYLQPTKTAEFIQFTTIITRTGVSFGDVKLKYA